MRGAIRIALQICLLAIFLHFFGLPAVKKFFRREVMLVKTTKGTKGLPAPSISVGLPSFGHPDKCSDSNDSIETCIRENTYNRSQTVNDVLLGFTKRESLREVFNEDYAGATRYYTFNLNSTIGTDGSEDQIFLLLFPDFVYTIFIHDPDYFLYSHNPVALPTIMTQFDTRTTLSQYYRLDLTEVHELNLPEDPCHPDPGYNFYTCVQKNTAKKVPQKFWKSNRLMKLFYRLGVEPSGTIQAKRTYLLAVMENNIGGKFAFRV